MEPNLIATAAVSGLVREGIRTAVESVRAHYGTPSKWVWSETALTSHLEWTASWSAGLKIGDMGRSESLEARTIRLGFSDIDARFLASDTEVALSDRDLLANNYSYLIEGVPGSGKTTAIKQICRLLLTEAESPGDHWQYPMLVLLRSLPKGLGLVVYLGKLIGLTFNIPSTSPHVRISDFGRLITCEGEALLDVVVRTLNDTSLDCYRTPSPNENGPGSMILCGKAGLGSASP